MADQFNPPLWRVMHQAYVCADPLNSARGYAFELRALADWLVPEESSETFLPGEDSHHRSKRQQRRHLRATLLIEAAKAEAGE
jgi:hypothetical protein